MAAVFSRLIAPVFRPTVRSLHGWALAAMISNAVVIATGAAVRLSSSGLGCPDWPTCTKSSAFASHSSGQTLLNSWIEFGNRLLNFPLVAIAGLTFIAFFLWHRQQRAAGLAGRKDLVWLADRKSTRLNSSHYALSRMPSRRIGRASCRERVLRLV